MAIAGSDRVADCALNLIVTVERFLPLPGRERVSGNASAHRTKKKTPSTGYGPAVPGGWNSTERQKPLGGEIENQVLGLAKSGAC